MNDTELLRCYAEEGSQEAFAELVRLRIGLVYSAALRQTSGDVHLAQETTQIVFTDLARKAAALCRHDALVGWLYTSTRYAANTIARAERRRRARDQEAYTMQNDLASAVSEIPAEKLRPLLDDAMHQLSETDRRTLLLRFFDGHSMADLGRKLGFSEATAKKRVERALVKLRDRLAARGLSSTATAVAMALGHEAVVLAAPAGLAATVSGSALAAASAALPEVGVISLTLMTTSKFSAALALSAVLGLLFVGTGVYEWQKAQRAETALADAAQRYEAGQHQLRTLSQASATADATLAALQPEMARRRTFASAKTAADQAKADATARADAAVNEFTATPEGRRLMANADKIAQVRSYWLVFARAGLTPAQIGDLANSLEQNGQQIGTADWTDERQRAILGDSLFQQLKAYSKWPDWFFSQDMAGVASLGGAPLTTEQIIQLADLEAKHAPRDQGGKLASLTSANLAAVEAEAQPLLSPAQWQAVQAGLRAWAYDAALDQARQNQKAQTVAPAKGG